MTLRTVLALWISAFCFFAAPITFAQSTETGETLERALFKAVKEKNWQVVEGMIAPYAQSINSDKIRNREELISYIKSLTFQEEQFGNFTTTQNNAGTIFVVTYILTYREKIDEEQSAGKQIKNLSVWEKIDDKWQWVAHAVID